METDAREAQIFTRRNALMTGLAGLGSLLLPNCSTPTPPTYGSLLRMGDNLTYLAHRALLPKQVMAKEYDFRDISSMPATGTIDPGDSSNPNYSKVYEKLNRSAFTEWQLTIEGRVTKPGSFSLIDLQKLPSRTQITKHYCEEGWSAIAQWTGVPLGLILQAAGIMETARFVNFHSYDGWEDSVDLYDAFHPQTILAYGMNGKPLIVPHGAPLRLRVETQIGYKSMKYLHKIVVTDEYVDLGNSGWAWYTGI